VEKNKKIASILSNNKHRFRFQPYSVQEIQARTTRLNKSNATLELYPSYAAFYLACGFKGSPEVKFVPPKTGSSNNAAKSLRILFWSALFVSLASAFWLWPELRKKLAKVLRR
jgi:hypothetical protein